MQYHRPPQLEKDLHCIWLHHYNPYLRLGPFKYETKHQNPEIAVIHDLVNPKETEKIKNLTRGKMKSTPYTSSGKLNAYSKGRTSKVKYLNERSVPEAMVLSKRIELATGFKLYHEYYASENYQVMNYGIGGKISSHVDERGFIYSKNNTESELLNKIKYGGLRMVTFMIYLSSFQAGGHTVFPQAGISVKPENGAALYWFNIGPKNGYDSRTRHLGCPVLLGNKWIANKWIRWQSNYNNFPCKIYESHFTVKQNSKGNKVFFK